MDIDAASFARTLWLVFYAYWAYTARMTKETAARESSRSRTTHLLAVAAGYGLILWDDFLPTPLVLPILRSSKLQENIGLVTMVIGMGWAVWARLQLGQNWSAAVTLKHEHHLIRTGPYRFVRHPIYTGIVLGSLGTAIVMNQVWGAAGFLLIFGAYLVKLRKEEVLLASHFPKDYPSYKSHTKRLFPFLF